MSKRALWTLIILLCLGLVALLIYSDYFGNVTIQNAAIDLLKLSIGAFLGAWANELSSSHPGTNNSGANVERTNNPLPKNTSSRAGE